MTLTDQLPSLRRTLPDPIALDAWPEQTRARVDDVVVGGLSLRAVVAVTGTPCVHAGAAVLPGTGGLPSPDATASVVVAMVVALVPHDGGTAARLDLDVGELPVAWPEARMLGRASTARRRPWSILGGDRVRGVTALVADLHPGDLLAIPVAGAVRIRAGALTTDVRQVLDAVPDPHPAAWLSSLR